MQNNGRGGQMLTQLLQWVAALVMIFWGGCFSHARTEALRSSRTTRKKCLCCRFSMGIRRMFSFLLSILKQRNCDCQQSCTSEVLLNSVGHVVPSKHYSPSEHLGQVSILKLGYVPLVLSPAL